MNGFSETWSLVKLGTTECLTHFQGTVLVILLILTFHNLRPFVHYLLSIICLPLLIFFYLFFNLMCRMTVEIQGRGAIFFFENHAFFLCHILFVSRKLSWCSYQLRIYESNLYGSMHIISIHFTLFVFLFMLSNHFRQFFTSGCMVFDVNVIAYWFWFA